MKIKRPKDISIKYNREGIRNNVVTWDSSLNGKTCDFQSQVMGSIPVCLRSSSFNGKTRDCQSRVASSILAWFRNNSSVVERSPCKREI